MTTGELTGGTRRGVPVGRLFDRRVTPITRRGVDVEGRRAVRIVVRDRADGEFLVLVPPDVSPLITAEPGRWYHLADLVGSAAPAPPVGEAPCPDCGGPTRSGCAGDTVDPAVSRAAIRLGVVEPFAVVSSRTAVTRPDETTDDRTGGPVDDPPASVCDACISVVA
jgi:hypothetical protein